MRSAWLLAASIWLVAADTPKPVDLTLKDSAGEAVSLRDLRGKIVVLNFWATWCGPCAAEMPILVKAEQTYGKRGVVFSGASLDSPKTRPKIPSFVAKYEVTFPVWYGATGSDMDKLRMGPAAPATAFLDTEGRIVARVEGQMRQEELVERLDWLLGDQSSPAPKPLVKHL